MKTVLITGASGYIGQHSIPFLLKRGYSVHALSREKRESTGEVHWHAADLLNPRDISCVVKEIKPTHLLHFAWYVEHGQFWDSERNLDWVKASLTLFQEFLASGGQRALFAGSCAEYDWNEGICREEMTPCKPTTLYGICKNSLWEIVRQIAKQKKISVSWGRIFHLYGEKEAPGRFIPSLIKGLMLGQSVPCTHGNQVRDFMCVVDAASAFAALLDSQVEGAVNIASGIPITLKAVALELANILGKKDLIQFGALSAPKHDPAQILADVARLQNEVGWKSCSDLKNGLTQTIEWWQNQILKANE